jgi:hypothetical protein
VQKQVGNGLTNVCHRATAERYSTATASALEAAEDNKSTKTILKCKADIGTEVEDEANKVCRPASIMI